MTVVPFFLNNARFLKRGVCAVLLDVAEALDGGIHDDGFSEFRYENTAALDIRSASDLASRIELGRAGLVRIAPADLRRFSGDDTTS